MRIAIVDDIASEREILHRRLAAQFSRLALYADILEYENGTDFLAAARKERFALAFLDIYMENKNGIDTAEELRSFDTSCLLVFTTSSLDHALDGFRVRALHYLVKPYTETDLASLLDEVMERLPVPDQYIEVTPVSGGLLRLRLKEILYAEHFRHQVHIYMADGQKIVTRQTFHAFCGVLENERFFLCSRGLIINLEHAADFDGKDFILKDGKKLCVSRSLAGDARLAFGDFLFQKKGGTSYD